MNEILQDCLDRLAAGQTVAQCLTDYPQYADTLRPLLELAVRTQRLNRSLDVEAFEAQQRGRARLLKKLMQTPTRRRRPYPALALVASLLLVMLFVGAVLAAQYTLPGDALYGFKQFGGNIEQQRVDEVRQLITIRREADVTFKGRVQQIEGLVWMVEGIAVNVPPGFEGAALQDAVIEIRGRTLASGMLEASGITIIEPPPPTPTYTPSHTFTPSPTPTLTLTPTVTSTVTQTRTSTATLTQTATLTLTPTLTTTAAGCVASRPDGWVSYRIQGGDTLSGLSVATGVTIDTLLSVNCLTTSSILIIGQIIFLPDEPETGGSTSAPGDGQSGSGDSGSSNDDDDDDDQDDDDDDDPPDDDD